MENKTTKALTKMYYTLGAIEHSLDGVTESSEKRELKAYINGLKYAIAALEEEWDDRL